MVNTKTILRWILIVGLLLVLATPLITVKSVLYPFVFGKALFLRTLPES